MAEAFSDRLGLGGIRLAGLDDAAVEVEYSHLVGIARRARTHWPEAFCTSFTLKTADVCSVPPLRL